jgi:hypothetical protein
MQMNTWIGVRRRADQSALGAVNRPLRAGFAAMHVSLDYFVNVHNRPLGLTCLPDLHGAINAGGGKQPSIG